MTKRIHIKFIAGCLLLLFAFSITPKLFLHDMFAGHVDLRIKKSNAPLQINPSGFNCDKDGVATTSPFVAHEHVVLIHSQHYFSPYIPGQIAINSAVKIYFSLRGPPHIIV